MAISKKGSRKIVVNDIEYLYKVSKIKKKSDWREQQNELNETFMRYARYYGLGSVKDITINIIIQLKKQAVSSCFIKIHSILVDGFMGPEQVTQIKPRFISELIKKALGNGWKPSEKGDYKIILLESQTIEKEAVFHQIQIIDEEKGEVEMLSKPDKKGL